MNHIIDKPEIVNAEAGKNLIKAEFDFMVDFKTLIHKPSVDPKLLQLKNGLRNNQTERAPKKFLPVFTELPKKFRLLFARDNIVVPEELKKQVVDALHFADPVSTKTLAESNIFR